MFKDDDENHRKIGTFYYFSAHGYSESTCLRQQGNHYNFISGQAL